MTTHSQRALILYRRRRFINHLLTYLLCGSLPTVLQYWYKFGGYEQTFYFYCLHAFLTVNDSSSVIYRCVQLNSVLFCSLLFDVVHAAGCDKQDSWHGKTRMVWLPVGSRNRFWCILALKSGIWWQQFEWFSWESTDQISCSLKSKGQSGPTFAQPIVLLM